VLLCAYELVVAAEAELVVLTQLGHLLGQHIHHVLVIIPNVVTAPLFKGLHFNFLRQSESSLLLVDFAHECFLHGLKDIQRFIFLCLIL